MRPRGVMGHVIVQMPVMNNFAVSDSHLIASLYHERPFDTHHCSASSGHALPNDGPMFCLPRLVYGRDKVRMSEHKDWRLSLKKRPCISKE